ncbi:MAG: HDOD domain-containing protein [Nitrospina sp.]|jgi:putative nucleotidyltransferase with HDIG domain|nr:HDOD domain-containing protein [Nitrospina sp.]MBT6716808.1 HDOD domain-containing protein [Nitrospina sp.]
MKVEDVVDDWVASPPYLYFKLKEVVEDPESSFKDIGAVILHDPALCARILKISNSPLFNPESQVETIEHALTFIGMNQLEELVLGTAVMEGFKGIPVDVIDINSFWKHSIACALTARLIAEQVHEQGIDRFYLLGILHDIGSLVIYKKAPKAAKEALQLSEENSKSLYEVETQVHGFNHAEAGAALFQAWKLPERLVEVVACHHAPMQAKNYSRDASIIHLADVISHELDLQGTGEGFSSPIDEKILQDVGLTPKDVSYIKEQLKEQFEKTAEVFLSAS